MDVGLITFIVIWSLLGKKYTDFLGIDYKVRSLSKSYLTAKGIILEDWNRWLVNSIMSKLTKRANSYTDGRTDPNCRKASHLKYVKKKCFLETLVLKMELGF